MGALQSSKSIERAGTSLVVSLSDTTHDDIVHSDDESRSIVVGLRSQHCVCANTPSNSRRSARSLLTYDIEEELGIDGDALALDLLDSTDGMLVVACDGSDHLETVQRIEHRGHYVRAVTPLLFLALGTIARSKPLDSFDLVVWQSDGGMDVAVLSNGKVVDWWWASAHREAVSGIALKTGEDKAAQRRSLLLNVDDVIAGTFAAVGDVERGNFDLIESAEREAERIVSGSAVPMLDLRNGPLESPQPLRPIAVPLRAFIACFFALQLCVAGAMIARTAALRSHIDNLVEEQELAFEETFPDERVPVGIISRLRSEQRRLAGTRGVTDQTIPQVRSAIPISFRWLSAMPEQNDASYWLNRIEFQPGRIEKMDGEAESYGELEKVASGMRDAGFDVPAVSANQTSKGVSLFFEQIGIAGEQGKW